MKRPYFSILMPVYNARQHLSRVLDDLRAQTYGNFEIIAVDDGSTDGSAEVLRCHHDKRLRVISLPENRGLVGALNAGLAEASGVWIARQDADDRCRADRLERQRNQIQARPEDVLFYSWARLIDECGWWRGTMRPPLDDKGLRWDLCFRNSVPHTSAVFPSALVRDEMGGYSGDNVTADIDLWSRLLRRGGAAGDSSCLVSYRNHSGSIMGREHASSEKPSTGGLREILLKNLMEWAGATSDEASVISDAWLDPSNTDWMEYFSVREKLAVSVPDVPDSLLAEQDYALIHLAAAVSRSCVSALMKTMQSSFQRRYDCLPKFRMIAGKMMNRF